MRTLVYIVRLRLRYRATRLSSALAAVFFYYLKKEISIMKHKFSASARFAPLLRRVSLAAWILRLVPIPFGLLSAKLAADVVSAAVDGNINGVLYSGGLLLATAVLQRLFDVLSGVPYEMAAASALHKCRLVLYRAFMRSPLSELYRSVNGDSIEKLNDDFKTVTGKALELYPSVYTGAITAAVYFCYISAQNLWLALILFGISLTQLVPPFIVKKYMEVNYDDCRVIESECTDYMVSCYYGYANIKLYNLKKWWLDGLKEIHTRYFRIGNRSTVTGVAESTLYKLTDNILKYGAYAVVGLFVLYSLCTLSSAAQAIALSAGFFAAVKTAFGSISSFAVANTAEKRLSGWFDRQTEEGSSPSDNTIRLEGVSLAYKGKAVLENASCVIDPEIISLVKGENGVGKSTVFRLVAGLALPDGGTVEIGGLPASEYSASAFPRDIFYLPQEDASFSFTAGELFEMVLDGNSSTASELARGFGLTGEQLDKTGIDSLSGGERKKVYLSLAFALDPTLLLLDEPTNSLDDESKKTLLGLLKKRGRGTVVITHDPMLDEVGKACWKLENGGMINETL